MEYFIGIVPPESYKQRIAKFQKEWENKSSGEFEVEPHITVKAQGGLTPDEEWMESIKNVCALTPPFIVTLKDAAFFSGDVLYLSVDSDEIEAFHRQLVGAVNPEEELIRKYMELEYYIPHLTLGQTSWGLSLGELEDMAEEAVEELAPFPQCKVEFVRVYRKANDDDIYKQYKDIPLKV